MQTILISNGNRILREEKAFGLVEKFISHPQNNTDFYEVDVLEGKASISIDQTRKLIEVAHLKPRYGKYCVVLIKEAQSMTIEAQNSLLKVLEEPPPHLVFILTADHPENLIDTVVSRCKINKLEISNLISADNETTRKYVSEFLDLIAIDAGGRFDWVDKNKEMLKNKTNLIELMSVWETVLRDLIILQNSVDRKVVYNNKQLALYDTFIEQRKDKLEYKEILIGLSSIKRDLSRTNVNSQLAIESFLVSIP